MARKERRSVPRSRLKVIHLHRIGRRRFRRVSELVFVDRQPKAVLEWVNMGGDRSPLYLELEAHWLHEMHGAYHTWFYEGETIDPRFAELPSAGTALAP